jgi:hypothetical protein
LCVGAGEGEVALRFLLAGRCGECHWCWVLLVLMVTVVTGGDWVVTASAGTSAATITSLGFVRPFSPCVKPGGEGGVWVL